jgi:hypothetical protein
VFIATRLLISFSLHEVVGVAGCLILVGPLVDLGALVELQCVLRRRSRRLAGSTCGASVGSPM